MSMVVMNLVISIFISDLNQVEVYLCVCVIQRVAMLVTVCFFKGAMCYFCLSFY